VELFRTTRKLQRGFESQVITSKLLPWVTWPKFLLATIFLHAGGSLKVSRPFLDLILKDYFHFCLYKKGEEWREGKKEREREGKKEQERERGRDGERTRERERDWLCVFAKA
jgi:hypothetical protein